MLVLPVSFALDTRQVDMVGQKITRYIEGREGWGDDKW